jgi:hypothetical protein
MILSAAGLELKRAVRAGFAALGAGVVFDSLTSRSWASITFTGERHRLNLCVPGPGAAAAAEAFLDGLAEREFTLRGHILADIAAAQVEHEADGQVRLTLEALTVEDA